MRAVTKVAIREARLKEIKHELLNSQKLQSYFEDNPRDLQLLRHDKSLHTVTRQAHLQNVPDYLGKLQFFLGTNVPYHLLSLSIVAHSCLQFRKHCNMWNEGASHVSGNRQVRDKAKQSKNTT